MHDRRRLALDALRIRGGLTVNELARQLRLTRTASAHQLARLLADGLATQVGLRPGVRRPSVIYGLTPQADRAFHQEYETLAVDVLDEVARAGTTQLDRVLRGVGDRWIARDKSSVQLLRGPARLERATKILAARGFMPSLEQTGRSYVLRNHHCPIVRVCVAHHEAPDMVKRWIQALVGTPLRRTGCICLGDQTCEYSLASKAKSSARQSAGI